MKVRRLLIYLQQYLGPCRCYATTKKKIPDPHHETKLPIFEYPKSKSGDRRVYVWGLAETGALGIAVPKTSASRAKNNLRYVKAPMRSSFAERFDVTHVAAGYGFSAMSIKTNEKWKVFGTGINTDSQIGYHSPRAGHPLELLLSPAPIFVPYKSSDTKITGLSAGRAHLAIVTDRDGVFTVGNNSYGQCGRKIIANEEYKGSMVTHNVKHIDGERINSVCCGQDHTLFLTEGGRVFACGWGADGQTGLGHYHNQDTPAAVRGDVTSETIVKLASTSDCVLALNDKGEVFGWGNSEYGQIPMQTAGSQQVNCSYCLNHFTRGLGTIVDIAAGGSFCLIVNDAGDVFVWGYGLLGLGPKVEHLSKPKQIPPALFGRNEFNPNSRVVGVAAGIAHLAALTADGDLFTWGRNRHGCLGHGGMEDQSFPLKVALGAHVLQVECGVDHSIAFCKPFV